MPMPPKEVKAIAMPNQDKVLPFDRYDKIIVSFSGGKDSLACVLHMLEIGVKPEQMELWHQAVDGEPGKGRRFMDWPVTEAYCHAVAWAIGIPLRFMWRDGGFWGEIWKKNDRSRPVGLELKPGSLAQRNIGYAGGQKGTIGTRHRFPAAVPMTTPALQGARWCTSLLKIDVARLAFTNLPEFKEGRFLLVTGERREESNNRAKYAEIITFGNPTQKRHVTQWRAVINWYEQEVWDIIKRWRIRPHPAYSLGFTRVSCMPCIFGTLDQWASIRAMDPARFEELAQMERDFVESGTAANPIQPGSFITQRADKGKSYIPNDPAMVKLGLGEEYSRELVIVPEDEEWKTPLGAFKKSQGGPT